MGRTNIVINDELVERAMQIYGLRTKREAVDLALRRLVAPSDDPHSMALRLRGIGWKGDLDAMRSGDPIEEF